MTEPDTPNKPSPYELQTTIDDCVEQLKEDWKGKLVYPVTPHGLNSTPAVKALTKPHELDICLFLGGAKKGVYNRLYFDTNKYNPNQFEDSWEKLRVDVFQAVVQCGSLLFCNGGPTDQHQQIRCNACVNRQNSKRYLERAKKETKLCTTKLINDKITSRGSTG